MVFETIQTMLAQCLGCDEDRIHADTVILEDLECSPDDLGEVFLGLEEEFGVLVPEQYLSGSLTVADLVRLVENQP